MRDCELYNFYRKTGAESLKYQRMLVAALPEIFKRALYRKYGFASIYEFAAKLSGLSNRVVDDALYVAKKTHDKPKLQKQIIKQGLNKVRVVMNAATPETDSKWAKKVSTMTKSELETHVRDIRKITPGSKKSETTGEDYSQAQGQNSLFGEIAEPSKLDYMSTYILFKANLDPKTVKKLEIIKTKMGKGTTWNDVLSRLTALAAPKPKRKYKQRPHKSRSLPAKKRRKMPETCEVPGCNKPTAEIHHVDRWAITKNDKNVTSLCRAHHKLAHRGYLDEKNGMKPLIKAVVDPVKSAVDKKMLGYFKSG